MRDKLADTEKKLRALTERGGGDGALLSAEDRRQIESYQRDLLAVRADLRAVQRSLRESLGWLRQRLCSSSPPCRFWSRCWPGSRAGAPPTTAAPGADVGGAMTANRHLAILCAITLGVVVAAGFATLQRRARPLTHRRRPACSLTSPNGSAISPR